MAKIKQKVCRLCLKDIKKGSFKTIDNIKIEMLEVLLIGMDLNICEETVICDQCAAKLQECFDFKSNCFFVEDCIVPFRVDNERLDLKMVIKKEMKIGQQVQLDNYKICRLCMQVVQDNDFIYFDNLNESASIRDMLQTCLSELDVKSTIDALICKICVESLKNYHDFKESCLDVEKKIKEYQSEELESNSIEKVELCDLLKKKNVKENVKRNVNNGRVESDSRSQSADDNDLKMDVDKPIVKRVINKKVFRGNKSCKYKCNKCSFQTDHPSYFKAHNLGNHTDNPTHMCSLCEYIAGGKTALKEHMKSHRGRTKQYGCKKCDFETIHKNSLKKHILYRHQKENAEVYKCSYCDYKTIHKSAVNYHKKKHHSSEYQFPIYKCPHCPMVTKYKGNLMRHLRTHNIWNTDKKFKFYLCSFRCNTKEKLTEHKEEIHMDLPYKCTKCLYASEHKTNLKRHMDTHQEPGQRKLKKCQFCNFEAKTCTTISFHMKTHKNDWEIKWFECDFCNFKTRTKDLLALHKKTRHSKMDELIILFKCLHCVFQTHRKESLRSHLLTHKNADEVEMFSCKQCCFKSKYRSNIQRHTKKVHGKELKKYKCSLCSYQAIEKYRLKRHQVVHLNPGERETRWKNLKKYKCSLCSYRTIEKYNLRRHQVVHLNPGETRWKDLKKYKCSLCSYRTIAKYSLRKHQVVHLNSGETQWKDLKKYKCSLCSYKTIEKYKLKKHQVVHLNPGETPMYQCATCNFETKYKFNLKYHVEVCKKKNNNEKRKQS